MKPKTCLVTMWLRKQKLEFCWVKFFRKQLADRCGIRLNVLAQPIFQTIQYLSVSEMLYAWHMSRELLWWVVLRHCLSCTASPVLCFMRCFLKFAFSAPVLFVLPSKFYATWFLRTTSELTDRWVSAYRPFRQSQSIMTVRWIDSILLFLLILNQPH